MVQHGAHTATLQDGDKRILGVEEVVERGQHHAVHQLLEAESDPVIIKATPPPSESDEATHKEFDGHLTSGGLLLLLSVPTEALGEHLGDVRYRLLCPLRYLLARVKILGAGLQADRGTALVHQVHLARHERRASD